MFWVSGLISAKIDVSLISHKIKTFIAGHIPLHLTIFEKNMFISLPSREVEKKLFS